ncbi:hypothetical protein [Neobacillus cucumis]|uniref:hypothetical protein n=1 Tax=Neobacillus cucumis TaxID=1740721 RepID=UPI0019656CA3|nr:hypothetical protein [Neobacillus cucumis]MBM7654181.1 energy-converting hydrogenase Eha subunit F [Neobacillus cucumis]
MKSLVGLVMTLLLLVGCTQTLKDKTQQNINNPPPQKQVKTNKGQAIGKEYGGKERDMDK